MKIHNEDKTKLVNSVFSKVHKKYDFMNDIMSVGIHRLWKQKMIDWMMPQNNKLLLDVASGTGDVAKIFSDRTKNLSKIECVEPNKEMLIAGKDKLKFYKNINWHHASAEKLPFGDNTFDFYTISYGIRNVTDREKALSEAHRILRKGGRFMCLEFSDVVVPGFKQIYDNYSDKQ